MNNEVSKEVRERVVSRVMRDLDPAWLRASAKIGLASVFGGFLSLLVCGQFGVGLTPAANQFNHSIHANMGPISCAIICGSLYAIFPVVILRFLLCHPIQFRAIVAKRWQIAVLWFVGFGLSTASFGHHSNDSLSFLGWSIAALAAGHLVAHLLFVLAPSWDSGLRMRLLRDF